MAGDVVS